MLNSLSNIYLYLKFAVPNFFDQIFLRHPPLYHDIDYRWFSIVLCNWIKLECNSWRKAEACLIFICEQTQLILRKKVVGGRGRNCTPTSILFGHWRYWPYLINNCLLFVLSVSCQLFLLVVYNSHLNKLFLEKLFW